MNAPPNPFKAALARGERQLGLWLALADGYAAEICAGAGFDWLLVDGEHAPNDVRSILQQLQAIAPYRAHAVVRPPIGETYLIKQLLDIGAQTLLIPMVESAAQASGLVAAVRYPPHGVRGVGSALARASRFNRLPSYLATAADEICLLVQIESLRGVENLEAIAATDGVDGVFIGPSDLAAAMGRLGDPGHEDVQEAVTDAIRRVRAAGKPAGVLSADSALARRYAELGATFVAFGTDVGLLVRGSDALLRSFLADEAVVAAPTPGAGY